MLYNYIMELKYYLIAFLLAVVVLLFYLFRKTETFEKNKINQLIAAGDSSDSDKETASNDPVLKNFIVNVLEDTPSCKYNPISHGLGRSEDDLKLKYLQHFIKLNGLRWSLKKINEREK